MISQRHFAFEVTTDLLGFQQFAFYVAMHYVNSLVFDHEVY